jgi:1-hydroxy-2-methyl-2-(E)-butenyl 4-diphosphate synthase
VTKTIKIGSVTIGGNNPVAVQSMTNTFSYDVKATVKQINALLKAGCEIVRLAVPTQKDLAGFAAIRKQIKCPLVADIHFDHRLAIGALEAGADKIRINPGNIGKKEHLAEIVKAAKKYHKPIRIGINAGSTEKNLVDLCIDYVRLFESVSFHDLVLSVKSSSVIDTIKAYRALSKKTDHPLHVGVTEAGTEFSGAIKSAVGIGALLAEGIGDTIRVSLTADPVKEVEVASGIAAEGSRCDLLSNMRQDADRCHQDRQRGGTEDETYLEAVEDRGDGLCGQWSGRGQACRCWDRRGERGWIAFQEGEGRQESIRKEISIRIIKALERLTYCLLTG